MSSEIQTSQATVVLGVSRINFVQAICDALREEMARDSRVVVIGEDVGAYGGVFGCTHGLYQEFGPERLFDTSISEGGIIGTAVGLAGYGFRPVAEIMIGDMIAAGGAMELIVNQAAKIPFLGGGQFPLPLVIRTTCGSRYPIASQGAHHGQCFESWFMHVPGLKVVAPSNPYDAKGLLKSAIRDDNPVLFFDHKLFYSTGHPLLKRYTGLLAEVPKEEFTVPIGKARVVRQGTDVTVVATMFMVHKALLVAEELAKSGISLEIVDPRSLAPLDKETIFESVGKTGRLVVVSEDHKTAGVTAEICALVAESLHRELKAPVRRVAALDVPYPYSPVLEGALIPDERRIADAVTAVMRA